MNFEYYFKSKVLIKSSILGLKNALFKKKKYYHFDPKPFDFSRDIKISRFFLFKKLYPYKFLSDLSQQ